MNTGEILRKFRIERGLSQLELEVAINASNGSISRIESNKTNATKETLLKIASFLDLDSFETLNLLGVKYNILEKYLPQKILKQKFFDQQEFGSEFKKIEYDLAFFKGSDYFIKECDSSLNTDTQEVLYVHSIINWRKVYKEDYANTYHVPIRMQKKKFARFILNNTPYSYDFKREDTKCFRQSKVITNVDFDYNLMILKDKLTIFLADPVPITLTIKDYNLTQMFKNKFNLAWDQIN